MLWHFWESTTIIYRQSHLLINWSFSSRTFVINFGIFTREFFVENPLLSITISQLPSSHPHDAAPMSVKPLSEEISPLHTFTFPIVFSHLRSHLCNHEEYFFKLFIYRWSIKPLSEEISPLQAWRTFDFNFYFYCLIVFLFTFWYRWSVLPPLWGDLSFAFMQWDAVPTSVRHLFEEITLAICRKGYYSFFDCLLFYPYCFSGCYKI